MEGEYWSSEVQGIRKSLFSSPVISMELFLQTELSECHQVEQDFIPAAWGDGSNSASLPRSANSAGLSKSFGVFRFGTDPSQLSLGAAHSYTMCSSKRSIKPLKCKSSSKKSN